MVATSGCNLAFPWSGGDTVVGKPAAARLRDYQKGGGKWRKTRCGCWTKNMGTPKWMVWFSPVLKWMIWGVLFFGGETPDVDSWKGFQCPKKEHPRQCQAFWRRIRETPWKFWRVRFLFVWRCLCVCVAFLLLEVHHFGQYFVGVFCKSMSSRWNFTGRWLINKKEMMTQLIRIFMRCVYNSTTETFPCLTGRDGLIL